MIFKSWALLSALLTRAQVCSLGHISVHRPKILTGWITFLSRTLGRALFVVTVLISYKLGHPHVLFSITKRTYRERELDL